jgi:hypothetical protein
MLLAIAFSYVLVRGSHMMMTGPDMSLKVALAKREQYGDDFLWFTRGRHQYRIRNTATLDRIDHLFDAERFYDPKADGIRDQLRPLERRESELDHATEALENRDEGPPLTGAELKRVEELRHEKGVLHDRMRDLERQEEEIDRKRDALEAEAERAMVPILDEAIRNGVATEVR